MSNLRQLVFPPLLLALCQAPLNACGNHDGRPGSLVSAGGGSARGGGGHSGHLGAESGEAGVTDDDSGASGDGGQSAGAGGDSGLAARPLAIYPSQLRVDVGCAASVEPAALLIRNGGLLPLTISSASATAGYVVSAELPLQIAAMESAVLQVTPPAPKITASVGDSSSGVLTFVTDEPEASTHEVQLDTTLFGGQLDFTDSNGTPLHSGLSLTYLSSDACPDQVKYRVHNTGNLAFTLFGPIFPTHLAGTSTGTSGQNVPPDEYVELKVSGNSGTDGACSGSGELTFTVQGSFCGAVPKLGVTWPINVKTAGCTCGK